MYNSTMAELKNLSVRHDQIMDWLIANPALPLSACAAAFGLTQPWLSCIIHSDLFQAELTKRKDFVFGEVALTVKDRITALAHDSLQRLQNRISVCDDVDQLNDTAELAIKALGFGAPRPAQGASVHIGSVNVVSREILAEARARMEGPRAIAHLTQGAQSAIPQSIEQAERVLE
jgi:hypothetical protein